MKDTKYIKCEDCKRIDLKYLSKAWKCPNCGGVRYRETPYKNIPNKNQPKPTIYDHLVDGGVEAFARCLYEELTCTTFKKMCKSLGITYTYDMAEKPKVTDIIIEYMNQEWKG
jgi:hypothetical protein